MRRLLAVAEHARAVKAVQEQRGVNLFRQWNEYAPGRAVNLMFRAIERFGLAERISWPCNVIVSNASGIAVEDPVFLNLPALRFHPAGPLYHGMGPSVIAMTWDSNLCLSVTADTRHVARTPPSSPTGSPPSSRPYWARRVRGQVFTLRFDMRAPARGTPPS
ncbi:hypothetical protein H7I76_37315, partial [Mycolicibacterium vaccae]|nr:hypothetical protein [Mycolicibacterium vaccae]